MRRLAFILLLLLATTALGQLRRTSFFPRAHTMGPGVTYLTPYFRASVSSNFANGTGTFTMNLPGPPTNGEIVIVACASDTTLTSDGISTSGYNNIHYVNDSSPGHQCAYKVMHGTPDTTITFNQEATSRTALSIQVWGNINTNAGSILDGNTNVATGGSGMPNCPTLTPNIVNAQLFAVGFLDDDDATSVTAPATFSNLSWTNTAQSSTTIGAAVMISSTNWSTGAVDPAVYGAASGSDAWRGLTFALQPRPETP